MVVLVADRHGKNCEQLVIMFADRSLEVDVLDSVNGSFNCLALNLFSMRHLVPQNCTNHDQSGLQQVAAVAKGETSDGLFHNPCNSVPASSVYSTPLWYLAEHVISK